jgi:hypothetical protein
MGIWVMELMIGIAGSVIGAVLIYLFSFGFRWTKDSRELRLKIRKKELADWKSGSAVKRQTISNSYLFSVLKFFVIGSILTAIANSINDLEPSYLANSNSPDYIQGVLDTVAAIFYLATFAKIIQFTRLLRIHA